MILHAAARADAHSKVVNTPEVVTAEQMKEAIRASAGQDVIVVENGRVDPAPVPAPRPIPSPNPPPTPLPTPPVPPPFPKPDGQWAGSF